MRGGAGMGAWEVGLWWEVGWAGVGGGCSVMCIPAL